MHQCATSEDIKMAATLSATYPLKRSAFSPNRVGSPLARISRQRASRGKDACHRPSPLASPASAGLPARRTKGTGAEPAPGGRRGGFPPGNAHAVSMDHEPAWRQHNRANLLSFGVGAVAECPGQSLKAHAAKRQTAPDKARNCTCAYSCKNDAGTSLRLPCPVCGMADDHAASRDHRAGRAWSVKAAARRTARSSAHGQMVAVGTGRRLQRADHISMSFIMPPLEASIPIIIMSLSAVPSPT